MGTLTGMLVLGATTACTLDPGEQDTAQPAASPTAEASETEDDTAGLDTRVGEPVWSSATSEDQSLLGLGAGVVRVRDAGSGDAELLILDASTGDELWRQGAEGRGEIRYAPFEVSTGVTADGTGLVTVPYRRGVCDDRPRQCPVQGFEVREALTGDVRWRWERPEGSIVSGSPTELNTVIGAGIVTVFLGDTVLALDVATGERVWEAEDPQGFEGVVRIEDDVAIVVPTRDRPLRFLDAETGEVVRALKRGDDAEGLVDGLLALREDDRIAIDDLRAGDPLLDVTREDGLSPVLLTSVRGLAWRTGDNLVETLLPGRTELVETTIPDELDREAVLGAVLLPSLEVFVVPTEEGLRVLDLEGALGEPAGPAGSSDEVALAGGSGAAVIVESELDEPDGPTVEVLPVG